jgi:hypothetical protein
VKIQRAIVILALVAAPISSVALVYYGPIWFLKAEIAEATEMLWLWMVREYGVTPAMDDCLDDWGFPPRDYYSLRICGGGWVTPPDAPFQPDLADACLPYYQAAENRLIHLSVAGKRGELTPLEIYELAQLARLDVLAYDHCVRGEPVGGDLTRYYPERRWERSP